MHHERFTVAVIGEQRIWRLVTADSLDGAQMVLDYFTELYGQRSVAHRTWCFHGPDPQERDREQEKGAQLGS